MNTLMQKRSALKRRNAWTGLLLVALLVNAMFAMAPSTDTGTQFVHAVSAPSLPSADVSMQQFLPAAIR